MGLARPRVGTFPLTFSYCEWNAQTGGLDSAAWSRSSSSPSTPAVDCTGPSGMPLPGGFGWVKPNDGACKEASIIGGMVLVRHREHASGRLQPE